MKFDHIGVVTASLAKGRDQLSQLLPIEAWTAEFEDTINDVWVQFGRDTSGICYELISPRGETSPVAKALKSGNNILNHVAYLVSDLATEATRVRAAGAVPLGEPKPAIAYSGAHIQFFLTRMKTILELIEAPGHQHTYL